MWTFGIVGVFAVVWVIALLVWKLGRVEQRWTQPDGD